MANPYYPVQLKFKVLSLLTYLKVLFTLNAPEP